MKTNPSTDSVCRPRAARPIAATFVACATACLLLGTALTPFAAPASAGEPVPAVFAALQEVTPSLKPPIDELREQVGKNAEVTFTVMAVGGRTNLYLNSLKGWRSADNFTAMLVPAAREELKKLGTDDPFDDLIGRRVRCRGELELDRDRVRIVVEDLAKQFELLKPEGASAEPGPAEGSAAEAAEPGQEAPVAKPPAADAPIPPSPDTPYVHPSIDQLRASVGEECVVTFRVMNAGGRSHLYINSQRDYRRSDCFTAQVEPAAVEGLAALGLKEPSRELIGKLLECRGKVQLESDRPNIVVTDVKKQLQIVHVPGEEPSEEAASAEESQAYPYP